IEVLEIALQLLEAVRRRNLQVVETACRMDGFELAFGGPGETLKGAHKAVAEQRLGPLVAKRMDHREVYTEYRYASTSTRHIDPIRCGLHRHGWTGIDPNSALGTRGALRRCPRFNRAQNR